LHSVASVTDTPLTDALLAAPAGVAALAWLESREREEPRYWEAPPDSNPAAVVRAVARVERMTLGELLDVCLAASQAAGPWNPNAVVYLARSYGHAEDRRPIADAIADCFGELLSGPFDLRAQQWWWSSSGDEVAGRPYPDSKFENVYGNGEFTWAGEWTVTDPPVEVHQGLVSGWDFGDGAAARWAVEVDAAARVYRVDRPEDWVALVERFPKVATEEHSGWELPGVNSRRDPDRENLESLSRGSARRSNVDSHVLPDWRGVATHYDGVHLSWAGFLTAEGYISDLPGGGVTMLRYWSSERTHWLNDVFGERTPLPAPDLSGHRFAYHRAR
jgi:hypothetical protein